MYVLKHSSVKLYGIGPVPLNQNVDKCCNLLELGLLPTSGHVSMLVNVYRKRETTNQRLRHRRRRRNGAAGNRNRRWSRRPRCSGTRSPIRTRPKSTNLDGESGNVNQLSTKPPSSSRCPERNVGGRRNRFRNRFGPVCRTRKCRAVKISTEPLLTVTFRCSNRRTETGR